MGKNVQSRKGNLLNKKAFTLIELLAVIVILAIIALIAVPIILNIIGDSKEESNKRSIDGYADAVKNAIAKQQLQKPNEIVKGNFTSTNGGKTLTGTTTLTVEYDGNVECSDIQIYEDGTFYLGVCKVNNESVNHTYGVKPKVYIDGEVVYFDVYNGVGCTEDDYHVDNSKSGYNGIYEGENSRKTTDNQNSCLKFFAFLDDGSDKVNLLLDHNTTTWAPWGSYTVTDGPFKLLEQLKEDTQNWNGTLTPKNYKFNGSEYDPDAIYEVRYDTQDYKHKARIITADEITEIIEKNGNAAFCGGEYWTVSYINYWRAYTVMNGTLNDDTLANDITTNNYPLRPVIEVLKSSLK